MTIANTDNCSDQVFAKLSLKIEENMNLLKRKIKTLKKEAK
jgi:hypothetical protein